MRSAAGIVRDPRALVLFIALAGASSVLGLWMGMAFDGYDMEASESPLLLAAARQLAAPSALYGPYDSGHHLVLIHAPLYYRLTALGAWPLAWIWGDPVFATLVVGRCLSGLGLLGILAGLFWLARLDGAGRSSGVLAALFFAAAPIQGGLAFEVRPDMVGSALVFLGLSIGLGGAIEIKRVVAGFVLLGLAVCVKQQNVVVAIAAAIGLAAIAPARWRQAAAGLATAIGVAAVILGVEEWVSGGLMSRSIVVAAGRVGRDHPATWPAAANLLLALVWKNVGPILITTAMALGVARVRPVGRIAAGLVVFLAAIVCLQMASARPGQGGVLAFGLAGLLVMMPILARSDRAPARVGSLDRLVLGLLVVELVLVAGLARLSTGAWYNYAITGEGFFCVLAGRFVGRILEAGPARAGFALFAAGTAAVAFAITDARAVGARRALERDAAVRVIERVGRPASKIYFADRPGDNRMLGRRDLVFDPWLYPVFESLGWAEPRDEWLGEAIRRRSITVVVVAGDQTMIAGVARDLRDLGYRLTDRVGFFRIWRG